jgi:hypothetical protein
MTLRMPLPKDHSRCRPPPPYDLVREALLQCNDFADVLKLFNGLQQQLRAAEVLGLARRLVDTLRQRLQETAPSQRALD